jgi:hypothetical protein
MKREMSGISGFQIHDTLELFGFIIFINPLSFYFCWEVV